jgi:hypothetical protein
MRSLTKPHPSNGLCCTQHGLTANASLRKWCMHRTLQGHADVVVVRDSEYCLHRSSSSLHQVQGLGTDKFLARKRFNYTYSRTRDPRCSKPYGALLSTGFRLISGSDHNSNLKDVDFQIKIAIESKTEALEIVANLLLTTCMWSEQHDGHAKMTPSS